MNKFIFASTTVTQKKNEQKIRTWINCVYLFCSILCIAWCIHIHSQQEHELCPPRNRSKNQQTEDDRLFHQPNKLVESAAWWLDENECNAWTTNKVIQKEIRTWNAAASPVDYYFRFFFCYYCELFSLLAIADCYEWMDEKWCAIFYIRRSMCNAVH